MSDWTIPNRVIVSNKYQPGQGTSLQEVHKLFATMERLKDPKDLIMPARSVHVEFSAGTMTGAPIGPGGVAEHTYGLTRVGARTLASRVLPSRGLGTLRHLAEVDAQGEKLATLAWAKFASDRSDDASMVRLVNVGVTDAKGQRKVVRAIRSVHGANYAPYSNVRFVEDILAHGKHFAQNEVLHVSVTDEVMRIRLRGAKKGDLVPVVEVWNSEVGQRSVIVSAGLFNTRTDGVVAHWSSHGEKRWIHSGNPDRIAKGVQAAFTSMFQAADSIREAYETALNAAIDDAATWMEELLLARKTPQGHIDTAKNSLLLPQVAQGSTVAAVVDAISIAASQITDPDQAYKVEQSAGVALSAGLHEAKRQAAAQASTGTKAA